MKPEDIENMQAGREMDEVVHLALWPEDEILQLPWGDNILRQCRKPRREEIPHHSWFCLPHYSTDIAAAWQVVEKLREQFPIVVLQFEPEGCSVEVNTDKATPSYYRIVADVFADTAPLAICRAALLTVRQENEK
jgi:Phage ABA sandwich domain